MNNIIRLVSFSGIKRSKATRVGLLINDMKDIIDLSSPSIKSQYPNMPDTQSRYKNRYKNGIVTIMEGDKDVMSSLKDIIRCHPSDSIIKASDVKLLPPIIPTRNIFCVGKNYHDHIDEVNKVHAQKKEGDVKAVKAYESGKKAVFFTKAPQCLIGHNAAIESHVNLTKWLDYEAELAIVIGVKGRDIKIENAYKHIWGYTIGNDVTARDLQKDHTQWFKGKSLDTLCPLGPCIIPSSEIKNPMKLNISLQLNNETMQDSNTSNMIFDIPTIIHQLSAGFTLLPGDVILTGTPAGVGYARKPPISLKRGDNIKICIEDIGTLENTVN